MKIEQGTFCPLVKGKCRMQKCVLFKQVVGVHPVTGERVDEWDCAFNWQFLFAMENTRAVRGTQSATESMRNDIVTRMDNVPPRNAAQFDLIDDVLNRTPQLIGPQ